MGLYVVIMGVQGAGKGTQASFISKEYGIPHISTGDLFRAMRTREDDLAKRIQAIMAAGQLIDDDTTNEVLKDRLEQPDAANGVILDGYPRNPAQAAWLESHLEEKGAQLNLVLLMKLDYYTAFKRAYGRVTQGSSGKTLNIYFNADELDVQFTKDESGTFAPGVVAIHKASGEKLKRRPDDEAASVVKRIDIFESNTRPLIEYYEGKGLLVGIDAAQSIDKVSADIKEVVDKHKSS